MMLKDTFMHFICNSIIHGIEFAKHRKDSAKPIHGNIYISARSKKNIVEIEYYDDGRGLNLKAFREKAVTENITLPKPTSDLDYANLIFRSGFSTARSITDMSGFGMGMDAAKLNLEQQQGQIKIVFRDSDQNEGQDFRMFSLIIQLPIEKLAPKSILKRA